MSVVKCPKCNYLIVNPSAPCPSCGAIIPASTVPPHPPVVPNPRPQPQHDYPNRGISVKKTISTLTSQKLRSFIALLIAGIASLLSFYDGAHLVDFARLAAMLVGFSNSRVIIILLLALGAFLSGIVGIAGGWLATQKNRKAMPCLITSTLISLGIASMILAKINKSSDFFISSGMFFVASFFVFWNEKRFPVAIQIFFARIKRPQIIFQHTKCPECGNDVSDLASECPTCGCLIAEVTSPLYPTTEDSFQQIFEDYRDGRISADEFGRRKSALTGKNKNGFRPNNTFQKSTSVTIASSKVYSFLGMFVIIAAVLLFGRVYRVYYGEEVFRITVKSSPGFKDTFVNLSQIFGMPRIAVAARHPDVKRQLEEMGIIGTDLEIKEKVHREIRQAQYSVSRTVAEARAEIQAKAQREMENALRQALALAGMSRAAAEVQTEVRTKVQREMGNALRQAQVRMSHAVAEVQAEVKTKVQREIENALAQTQIGMLQDDAEIEAKVQQEMANALIQVQKGLLQTAAEVQAGVMTAVQRAVENALLVQTQRELENALRKAQKDLENASGQVQQNMENAQQQAQQKFENAQRQAQQKFENAQRQAQQKIQYAEWQLKQQSKDVQRQLERGTRQRKVLSQFEIDQQQQKLEVDEARRKFEMDLGRRKIQRRIR